MTGIYAYSSLRSWESLLINNNASNVFNLSASEIYSKNTSLKLTDIVIDDLDSENITVTLTLNNSAAGRLSMATTSAVTSSYYNVSPDIWIASGALDDVAGVTFTPASNFRGSFTTNTSISDGPPGPLLGSKDFTVILASTTGNDTLTGSGFSNDTVTYASATSLVTVSLLTTTQHNTVGPGLDTLTGVENLIGSAFNDNLIGNTTYNVLDGKDGNDTLKGWSGAGAMNGELGNDTYFVADVGDKVTERLRRY